MFEHVGRGSYGAFFAALRRLLREDGAALLHSIGDSAPPGPTNPFICKYVSPGGCIPSLSEVPRAVERSGLPAADIEIPRLHHAETLRHSHVGILPGLERSGVQDPQRHGVPDAACEAPRRAAADARLHGKDGAAGGAAGRHARRRGRVTRYRNKRFARVRSSADSSSTRVRPARSRAARV